jgi:hypothetical protein
MGAYRQCVFTMSINNDFDICECGCYRKNHLYGKGLCRVCSFTGTIIGRCTGFRLLSARLELVETRSKPQMRLDLGGATGYNIK